MEVLTPESQSEEVSKPTDFSNDLSEAGITFKNLTFLSHLGLKDEMLNPDVMEKVQFLADRLELDELEMIDLKLGHDDTPRIDKIFAFMKLDDMEKDLNERRALIHKQKESYERN